MGSSIGQGPTLSQADFVTGRLCHRPTLSQADFVTGRLGHRPAWSQAGLVTAGVAGHRGCVSISGFGASSSAAHAAGWHRLHTSILAWTVPGPFVQIAFADECLQWWLLFPVVVRTLGSPKLCTEVFSLVMWCVGRLIGHMPSWALPTFCVRGGMPTEHPCIPKCVAGSSLAQGALTLLECVACLWSGLALLQSVFAPSAPHAQQAVGWHSVLAQDVFLHRSSVAKPAVGWRSA